MKELIPVLGIAISTSGAVVMMVIWANSRRYLYTILVVHLTITVVFLLMALRGWING